MHAVEVSFGPFVAGWRALTVHDFLETLFEKSDNTKFALITCLDSNCQPARLLSISPELAALRTEAEEFGHGILVATTILLKQPRLFFGFDEVWFFASRPSDPKPADASIVGPARVDQRRMDAIGEWFVRNHGTLGLGGGEGLNFVVKAPRPARWLIASSLDESTIPATNFSTSLDASALPSVGK
jgi:hypothetical protein